MKEIESAYVDGVIGSKHTYMQFLGQSTRIITTDLGYDRLEEFLQKKLRKLDSKVKLVVRGQPDVSSFEKPVFLQRFSSEWNQFVDVTYVIEIVTKDRHSSLL